MIHRPPARRLPTGVLPALGFKAAGLAAALATACLAAAAAGATEGGLPIAPLRLLASGGVLFSWDGVSTDLRPAPAGLASGPLGFRSVLPIDAGRALLVEPAAVPAGKQKEKKTREGEAVVLGLGETGAERGPVVPFEGLPSAAAVSPDGRRAYVLAWRGDPGGPGARGWLHAIDVDRGVVADSSLLSSPAFGLATDAAGARLYVGLRDRIQTYGAEPVRVSWQYRSPGVNGPIAVSPGADLLAVGRGSEVALFDAARLAATGAEARHSRKDDATTVASVPFAVTRLTWAEDGSLLAAIGDGGLVFIDPGNGALLWPASASIDFTNATDALVLEFPGSNHDVVVAVAPRGSVSALRAPAASAPVPAATRSEEKPAAVEAIAVVAPAAPPAAEPVAEPVPEPVAAAETPSGPPAHDPAPEPPTPTPAANPQPGADQDAAPQEESGPPRLRGHVNGRGAKTIVLYGPNNILKEATRTTVQEDGTWSLDLPAPGTYRIVAIGDGSTPIPVVPSFRTVTVRPGIGESGIDFEVRPAP